MKRIIFSLSILALLASCAEDKGNYDYSETNELSFAGIESSYELEQFSELSITPTITGSLSYNEADYDYLWYIYKVNGRASEQPDTLSHEKNLTATISKAPGSSYRLMYEVTDRTTGRRYFSKSDVSVVNTYSKGLAILSDVEGMAQVSFINSLDKVTEDAYQAVNGRPVGRGPIGIFLAGRNSNSDNLIVVSTEDSVVCCNHIDFSYTMNFQDMFYFPSTPGRLTNLLHGRYPYNEYAIVDGKVFKRSIYVWSDDENTLPLFTTEIAYRDGDVASFNFYGDNSQPYFWDPVAKKFVYDTYYNIGDLEPGYANEYFDPSNVGMDMVWGATVLNDEGQALIRSIMKDSDGKTRIIWGIKQDDYDLETWASWYFITPSGNREVTGAAASATVWAISSLDPNFIYYATGNKIVCMSVITGNTISETTVEGSQIDCMEFDPSDNTKLYVGTSDGSAKANSGSVFVLSMQSNGSLTLQKSYKNICGRVVDFETNTGEEE